MRISRFWAKGYRSLRDIALDPMGDFNTFYGPNGSGKSNVLDALHMFFRALPFAVDSAYGPDDERLSHRDAGQRVAEWIRDDDFFAREPTDEIVLGAVIEDPVSRFEDAQFRGEAVQRVEVSLRFSRLRPGQFNLQINSLRINSFEPDIPFVDADLGALLRRFSAQAFTQLGVTRTLSVNAFRDGSRPGTVAVGTLPDGEVVRALFQAKNARDRAQRERYELLRRYMQSHLHRGLFDVFMDPDTQELELRETLPDPNPLGLDIRVDRAGHGVVQLYAIVASIMLGTGRLVAIEEPEAHLHAPTVGIELRALLEQMVKDGSVGQLFIATHSNLFDLDASGYWDVSLVGGETRVARKPLDDIDAAHLYEPGPAKHILLRLLKRYGDEFVFRTGEGERLTASAMIEALRRDDPVAVEFLRAMHTTTLETMALRAQDDAVPEAAQ